jgi:hypothetical protein
MGLKASLQGQEEDSEAEMLKILQLNNCFSLSKKNGESPVILFFDI